MRPPPCPQTLDDPGHELLPFRRIGITGHGLIDGIGLGSRASSKAGNHVADDPAFAGTVTGPGRFIESRQEIAQPGYFVHHRLNQ